MAPRKPKTPKATRQMEGAGEFLGDDTEQAARDKIAAAEADADKTREASDANGGPILDEDAYRRAVTEMTAETIELEEIAEKQAEVRGRISSIKKVAEKCGVDWDVVKVKVKLDRRVAKGESGAIVTELRRLGALMRLMASPLHTQFGLFPEEPTGDEPAPNGKAAVVMEAELQGQHAYGEGAKLTDNPFHAVTDVERHIEWAHGWTQAQNAKARDMGPAEGAPTH